MFEIKQYHQKHYTSDWPSHASVLYAIVVYLIFVVPFYVSFTTQSFWFKLQSDQLGITYTYSGNHIIFMEYALANGSINTQILTNIPQLYSLNSNKSILASYTFEGYVNTNSVNFALNVSSGISILNTQVIAFMQVTITSLNQKYNTAIILNIPSKSYNFVSGVIVTGNIQFQNGQPISAISSSGQNVNSPPYLDNFQYITNYAQIKYNTNANNYQIKSKPNIILTTSTTLPTVVSMSVTLLFSTTANITYYPSFLQTLKNAFSQYLSVFIVAFLLGRQFLKMVCRNNLVDVEIVKEN